MTAAVLAGVLEGAIIILAPIASGVEQIAVAKWDVIKGGIGGPKGLIVPGFMVPRTIRVTLEGAFATAGAVSA
jgi:hypothetical protein